MQDPSPNSAGPRFNRQNANSAKFVSISSEYALRDFNAGQWREGFTLPMRLAELWVRYAPRGKGWVPRWVGRHLCAGQRVFMRTRHGARLAVGPSNLDVYTYIISQGHSWDEHVVDACASALRDDGVFYDIGASVGYISMEMALQLNGRGAVIAFEPQPELAAMIATSARLNDFNQVRVFDVMLGDQVGDSCLHIGSHSIHASAIAREAGSRKLACTVTTLDSLVQSGAIPPPSVIKIDVEGAEIAALTGASQTIRDHRPHIIFESDENMDRYGYRRKDLLDLLSALCPYEFAFITAARQRIPITPANLESREHADVLASPPSRAPSR